MPQILFYPLDVSMKVLSNRASVVLYGRTVSGERISVVDTNYLPYFYIVPKEANPEQLEKDLGRFIVKVRDELYSIVRIEKKIMNLAEKETAVLKAYVNNPFGIAYICTELMKRSDIKELHEHDIPFITSYLLDRKIIPGIVTLIEGEIMNSYSKVPVIRADSIVQEDDEWMKKPKILAFDIETYSPSGKPSSPDNDPVIMVSLHSDNFSRTITWKKFASENQSTMFVESESALLSAFKKTIEEFQPDFLVGYTSDIFAFPYMKRRAEKHGMRFDIGLDHSAADITKTETSIKGITHIDIYKFISKALGSKLETDTFRLSEVAMELIGETKKELNMQELSDAWDSRNELLGQYCERNLQSAELIYKLTKELFPLIMELTKLTSLEIYQITRAGFMQFIESFLMKESRLANEIIPSRPGTKEYSERTGAPGAQASTDSAEHAEPEAGIYKNIAVFDFRSLYPSIIATHNISPGTLKCRCCNQPVPEENMHFCSKKIGFFPKVLSALIERKERIAKILRDGMEKTGDERKLLVARQESLKLLADSFFSNFSSPSSRWYCIECARAVNAYNRHYVSTIIGRAKKEKFEVMHSDNDSVFIRMGAKKPDDAKKFLEELNSSLPEKISLDYDGFYPKAMFISSRTGKSKKYALLSAEGFLKIKGLESSRRNFSSIAKETQEKVLYTILKEGKLRQALSYVSEVIDSIKENKVPMNKMIIYMQMQKELTRYETIAPHVAVAKKMQEKGFNVSPGSIIRYVVAQGEGTIAEKSQLPNEAKQYDSEYYINNQVIPAVDKIFEAAGVDFMKALQEKEQSSLSEFI